MEPIENDKQNEEKKATDEIEKKMSILDTF